MILRDYHTHTNFCDGKNTPEEMVEAAVEKGLDTIGFSGHGYTRIDGSYCMSEEETREYIKEINRLKEKYTGKINIRLGIERDYFSEEPARGYDYIIGSVHYVRFGDEYVPVDSSADIIRCAADRYCGGDIMVFCEKYYENVSHLCDDVVPDIIGHFDLVMKFNEKGELFDKNDPRYVAAWKKAADILLKYDIPFEINTGAISRGYRTEPYPDKDIYEYLKDRGAKLILTGDTHKKENLCYEFEKFAHLANTFDIKRRICMIGHRGYSSAYPENTALAFMKAAENGSGGCETDVRITSDGEYVCCHNEDAVFCDGTSLVISESTYEQLTAKPLKNGKTGDDVRLCSFREYLEIMKKYGMVCFVELKGEYSDPQVKGVFDLVEQVYDLKKCILQSFSVENLQKARALFPSLPLMLTYGLNESHYEICFEYGLSLDIDYFAFKEEMIEQFHSRGLEIALWTVNDPDDFERMKKYNVDYIESDVFGG